MNLRYTAAYPTLPTLEGVKKLAVSPPYFMGNTQSARPTRKTGHFGVSGKEYASILSFFRWGFHTKQKEHPFD